MKSLTRERNVTCGKCGQKSPAGSAHNARTCGKVKRSNPTHITEPAKVASLKTESVKNLTPRNIFNAWEKYTKTLNTPTNNSGNSEEYSAEEILTLWLIMCDADGKIGKGKGLYREGGSGWEKVWGEKEEEQLETFITNLTTGPPVSPKTWHTFFKSLGAKAKTAYLKKAVNPHNVEGAHATEALNDLVEELEYHIPPSRKKEPTVEVPIELIPAFLKDSSVEVRRLTASLPNLPEVAGEFLVRDRKVEVLLALARNPDQTSNVLTEIEERLEAVDNGNSSSAPEESGSYTADYTRRVIVAHPNISQSLLNKYFREEKFYKDEHMRECLYKNPLITAEMVKKHREGLVKNIRALKRKRRSIAMSSSDTERTLLDIRVRLLEKEYDNVIKYGHGDNAETAEYIEEKIYNWDKGENRYFEYRSASRALKEGNLTPNQVRNFYNKVKKLKNNEGFLAGIVSNKNVTIDVLEDIFYNTTQRHIGVEMIAGGSFDFKVVKKYTEKVLRREGRFRIDE